MQFKEKCSSTVVQIAVSPCKIKFFTVFQAYYCFRGTAVLNNVMRDIVKTFLTQYFPEPTASLFSPVYKRSNITGFFFVWSIFAVFGFCRPNQTHNSLKSEYFEMYLRIF